MAQKKVEYGATSINRDEKIAFIKAYVELEAYALHKPFEEFKQYVLSKDRNLILQLMQYANNSGHKILYQIYSGSRVAKGSFHIILDRIKLCMSYGAEPFYKASYGYPNPGRIDAASYSFKTNKYTSEEHKELQLLFKMGLPAYEAYEKEKKAQLQATELIRQQQEEIRRQAEQQEEAKRKALEEQRIRLVEEQRRLDQMRLAEKEAERQREKEEAQRQIAAEKVQSSKSMKLKIYDNAQMIFSKLNETCSNFFEKMEKYGHGVASSFPDAFGRGATHALLDIINLCSHPYDNFLYPISILVYDATIIAAHHNTLFSNDPDVAFLRSQLSTDSNEYKDAVKRMEARSDGLLDSIDYLINAKAEQQTKEFFRLFVSVYFMKAAQSLAIMKRNFQKFNKLNVPLFASRERYIDFSSEVKLVSLNEIRNYGKSNYYRPYLPGQAPYMYVIDNEGNLIITKSGYYHVELGKGNPVAAAGTIYVNKLGLIFQITNESGGYLPFSGGLDTLLMNKFQAAGFKEVTLQTFRDFVRSDLRRSPNFLAVNKTREIIQPLNFRTSPSELLFGAAVTREKEQKKSNGQKPVSGQKASGVFGKQKILDRKRNHGNFSGKRTGVRFTVPKEEPNANFSSPSKRANQPPQCEYITLLVLSEKKQTWSRGEVMNWIKDLREQANRMPDYLKSSVGFYTYRERCLLFLSRLEELVVQHFDTMKNTVLSRPALKELRSLAEDRANREERQKEEQATTEEKASRKAAHKLALEAYALSSIRTRSGLITKESFALSQHNQAQPFRSPPRKINKTPQCKYIELLILSGKKQTWNRGEIMNWIKDLREQANLMPDYLKSSVGFYTYRERCLLFLSRLEELVVQHFDTMKHTVLSRPALKELYSLAEDRAKREERQKEEQATTKEKASRKAAHIQALKAHEASLKAEREIRKMENFNPPPIYMGRSNGFFMARNLESCQSKRTKLKQGSYYSFESRASTSERTSNAYQSSGNQRSTSRGNSSAYQSSRFFSSGKARSSSKSTVSTPMRGWLFGGSDISPGSDASPAPGFKWL